MDRLIVEIIGPSGQVLHRWRSGDSAFGIGRAYGNELILDDSYVDAFHLRVEREGEGWKVADLGSLNGLFVGREKNPRSEYLFDASCTLRVGESRLRLVRESSEVPAATLLPIWSSFQSLLGNPWVVAVMFGLLLGTEALDKYLGCACEFSFKQVFSGAITFLTLALLWATAGLVFGRLVSRRIKFVCYLNIAVAGMLGLQLLYPFTAHLEYVINWPLPATIVKWGALFLLAITVLHASLKQAAVFWTRRRRWLVSIGLPVLIFSIYFAGEYVDKPEFNFSPSYSKSAKAPFWQWTPATTPDQFWEQNAKLFDKLEKDRLKELERQEEIKHRGQR